MITASIKFLTNSLMADLTCRDSELRSNLQSTGSAYAAEYDTFKQSPYTSGSSNTQ